MSAPRPRSTPRHARGLAPLAGVLLLATTVVIGAAVAGVSLGLVEGTTAPATASLSLDVDGQRLVFVHRGGSVLDVDRLRLVVSVDGERLRYQPPVPFFAARGFRAGPTGPFNSAADAEWTAGERATLRLASTNAPTLDAGDRVVVRVYGDAAGGETVLARLTVTAG